MTDNLFDATRGEYPKIKTHFAQIIVDGTAEKPYYNIMYFDPTAGDYRIGFGSYCLDYVFKWLAEEFEIVETRTNADRIRAMSDEELAAVLEIWAKNGACINSTQRSCDGCPLIPLCRDCKEGYELDWLKQPVKDGEG